MERRKKKPDGIKIAELDESLGESDLYYNVEDTPPIGLTVFFGFQIALANVCYILMMTLIVKQLICADNKFATYLFSSVAFMAGLTTIIQSYFGVRIPIFQGPTPVFLLPYINAANDPRWGCNLDTETSNITMIGDNITESLGDAAPPWQTEWAKISGAMMVSQCVQMLMGATGLIFAISRIIRPVSICVVFILIGFYCQSLISDFTKVHWGLSILSIAIMIFFSQYIHWIQVPLPTWRPTLGFAWTKMPLFELFPVLFAVMVCWVLSAIITAAGGFPDDETDIRYQARTDIHSQAIADAPVFIFPHPGQFAGISFSVEYFIIFLVSVLTTVLESMGDYYQYAMSCCLPRPPAHAMNRGIFMEGFCGFFAGLIGMGLTTTSYSNMVGIIQITKVASRQVYGVGGVMLMLLAVFGKVGAVFVSIPKPVLAGPVFIGIALLVGATFMNLKKVDLGKARNQTTLGCSIMFGFFVPLYFQGHQDEINTGSAMVDRIIISVLTIPFLLGGIISIFLDTTLPGRTEMGSTQTTPLSEKSDATELQGQDDFGQMKNTDMETKKEESNGLRTYDEMMRVFDPPFITKYTRRWKWTRYIPMLPNPYPDESLDITAQPNGDLECMLFDDEKLAKLSETDILE